MAGRAGVRSSRSGHGGALPTATTRLPAAARAADLVARMTRDEKIAAADDGRAGHPAPRASPPTTGGTRRCTGWLAPGGPPSSRRPSRSRPPSTSRLVHEVADVISDEARAKFNGAQARGERGRYQGLTFFAPNLNIFRDPRWGRGQETFGEDPLLTARMGVAFITGLQGDDPRYAKTIATAKHFAVHSGPEASRHGFDARPSAHDLVDTYLPQFEAAVREGRVGSVMAAYNRLDGEPCAANPRLLQGTLRDAWGFGGYVVGDCGAVEDIFAGHHAAPSREAAAAAALRAGTDLDCGSAYAALGSALDDGLVGRGGPQSRARPPLHGALSPGAVRSPRARPLVGAGRRETSRRPLTWRWRAERRPGRWCCSRIGTARSRSGANVRHIAVVGPTADDVPVLLANYHGTPSHPVTLLEGIRTAARARGVSVAYARGARLLDTTEARTSPRRWRPRERRTSWWWRWASIPGSKGRSATRASTAPAIGRTSACRWPSSRCCSPWAKPGGRSSSCSRAEARSPFPGPASTPPRCSTSSTRERKAATRSPTCCSARSIRPGRLPFTMYREVAYLPRFDDYTMVGRTYRYIDLPPLYPFGFGRSYTSFRYANLEASLAPGRGGTRDRRGRQQRAARGRRGGPGLRGAAGAARSTRRTAGWRPFRASPWRPGSGDASSWRSRRAALTWVDEQGLRQPVTGEVAIAVGGGQPDHLGQFADDAHGLTAVFDDNWVR